MANVLLITSSPRGEASYSTQVATSLAEDLGGRLTVRELWKNPPQPIGPEFVEAAYTPKALRTPQQVAILRESEEAIAELFAADTIIVAAGMINFGLPSALKAWIDLVVRKGETFQYGERGPEGLLKGKKLVLVLASGGVYSEGPHQELNHLERELKSTLGFIGLTDVQTIWIEGVAMGADSVERALAQANARSRELLAVAA